MNKELAKNIMTRSRLKNNSVSHKTKSSWIAYKEQRNKCTLIEKQEYQNYFSKKTEKGIMSNKAFWKIIRPFLSNKSTRDKHDNASGKWLFNKRERKGFGNLEWFVR